MSKFVSASAAALVTTLLTTVALADIPESSGGGGGSITANHPTGVLVFAMVAIGVALMSIVRRTS